MDKITQQLQSQPPPVKRSMISKLLAVVNPSMTDHRPPEVQNDTRGRPTDKARQQRNEEADKDDPKKKVVQCSRLKKSKDKEKICDEEFPLLVGDRYKNVIETFKEWLPTRYRPYITDIENVQPDGNCSFRSIARGLGMEQNQWLFVRQQLLDEMIINEPLWIPMFCNIDNELYNDIYDSIYHLEVEPAPYRKWMQLPYAGLLAAQKFGVIIQHFSNGGNQTYFPMFDGPTTCRGHTTISIALSRITISSFLS
ncbi:putative OTU domain-containing protein [Helianthus debilis subsp. tardiflorus]